MVSGRGLSNTLGEMSGPHYTKRFHLNRKSSFASQLCVYVAVLLISLLAPSAVSASTIEINTLLTDPSFESLANGCPTAWTCNGSPGFGTYTPTSSQYTPGADGLPGLQTGPDGNFVSSGSGSIYQTTAATWAADTTYTFTFFLGTPNTLPDGTTPVIGPPTGAIRLYFLKGNVQAGMPAYDLEAPLVGQWTTLQYVVTPEQIWDAVAVGSNIGVMFFVSPDNYFQAVNIDIDVDPPTGNSEPIPPAETPEPATFVLVLPVIALLRLARSRAHSLT